MNSDKVCNSRGVDTSANMKKKKAVTLHYQLGNEREFLKKVFKENKKVTLYRTNYSLKNCY